MKSNWHKILKYGGYSLGGVTLTGVAVSAFMFVSSLPSIEQKMAAAGYKLDLNTAFTCYNSDGSILLKEQPESIVYEGNNSVTAHYPRFFNGIKDVVTRRPTHAINTSGCTFEKVYTPSDMSAEEEQAPILVTIFDGENKVLAGRYTSTNMNRNNGLFTAEFKSKDGFVLKELEVMGLTSYSTQITDATPKPYK